ncbi:MAG: NAD(P)-dependent oxidoreductase [Actinobacteria bacterium]|nr:MAG: NAD(P)-dependent oxidoreductase [Actinomycetota bacterium]RIK06967.1 MAG: hypothetical protein DCC48_05645 [Acidobacteriota bacterium]
MSLARCAVTGASGFLGSRLVQALVGAGSEVVACDQLSPASARAGVHYVRCDICDRAAIADALDGVDTVFHLSAVLPQRHAPAAEMRRVNVTGTATVLGEALRAGVRRLVLLSSSEVYGALAQIPCPETARLAPIGEYGRNKVAAEALLAQAEGIEWVALRPPTIVGAGMREPLFDLLFRSAARGRPLVMIGDGGVRLQMISVDDMVSACLLAATAEGASGQVLNIGFEPVATLDEVVRQFRSRLGLQNRVIRVPGALARPLLHLAARLPGVPLEPDHAHLALADYLLDTSRAQRVLGRQPSISPVDALLAAFESARR